MHPVHKNIPNISPERNRNHYDGCLFKISVSSRKVCINDNKKIDYYTIEKSK